jgi:hypothetical protein
VAGLLCLPPGLQTETFTYADGRQVTVYRAPYRSEGPVLTDEHGTHVLCYMFAEYVFRWPERTTRVDIGHGSIGKHMGLREGVTITGRWSPGRLAEFGQHWVAEHLRKFGIP